MARGAGRGEGATVTFWALLESRPWFVTLWIGGICWTAYDLTVLWHNARRNDAVAKIVAAKDKP
jgi:hypothetical protein